MVRRPALEPLPLILLSSILAATALAGVPPGVPLVTFTDAVNLRAAASTEAAVLGTLPLGTEVQVLETGAEATMWGRTEPWVRVKAAGHQGWLWSGLLTNGFQALQAPGDLVVVGLRGVAPQQVGTRVSVEVGARAGGQVLEPARTDLDIPAGWTADGVPFTVTTVTSGLPGADPVVRLRFSAGYCGGRMGNLVYARDGDRMVHLGTFEEGSDAPVFLDNDLVFPAEEGGRPGVVLHVVRSGEWGDDGEPHYDSNVVTEHHLVDGRLVPPP